MTFEPFMRFPPEVHSLILEQCLPNDAICLSLTSKYFFTLSGPLITKGASLTQADSTLSLSDPNYGKFRCCPWHHRWRRHAPVDRTVYAYGTKYPPGHEFCHKQYCRSHCSCFHCPLYKRLGTWMPKNYLYCLKCNRFTKRSKSHPTRCSHSQRWLTFRHRRQRRRGNLWTYRKNWGGFSPKLWKMWFNNRSMERWNQRTLETRKDNKRYDLRGGLGANNGPNIQQI